MSDLSNYKKNVIYGYLIQIITIFLVFINRTIFIKTLGMEMFGIDNLFKEILSFISLADLGLENAMSFAFYKPLVEKDNDKLSNRYIFFSKIYKFIGTSIFVVGIILLPFLSFLMKKNVFKIEYYAYFILILFYNCVRFFYLHKVILLNADQKSYINSRLSSVLSIVRSVCQMFFLLVFKSFLLYLLVDVAISIIYLISYNKIIKSNYKIDYTKKKIDSKEKKKLSKILYSASLNRVFGTLLSSTDNTLISYFIGVAVVGVVASYKLLFQTFQIFYSIVFSQSISFIGKSLIVSKEKSIETFKNLNTINFAGILALLPCIYACINDFVGIWLGKENQLSNIIVLSLILDLYLNISTQIIMVYRESSGIFGKIKYYILLSAIMNLILSIALSKYFGLFGILFATPVSKILGYVIVDINNVHKYVFSISPKEFYYKYIQNIIFLVLIFAFVYNINVVYSATNLYYLIVKGLIILIVSSIISLFVYNKDLKNNYFINLIINKYKGENNG